MKLGYFTLTDNPPAYGADRRDPNQMIQEVLEEAVYAEELGFSSVWVPEHHFSLFGVNPSPTVLLSYIAAKTKRVQLAAATVVLPLNHPVKVAEEWALLDLISNGRAIFSAGRGYDKREYDAFEVSFETSPEHFREGLDIVRRCWTEDEFTYEGKFYKIREPIRIVPRPVQKPYIPTYVACFSRPTLEMAAREGFNSIFAPFAAAMMFGSVQAAAENFREIARAAGHANTGVRCSYFVNVVHSHEEEMRTKERLLKYLHGVLPAFPSDPEKTPPHIRYFVDIVRKLESMKPQDLGERSIVTGDAEQCIATLKKCEEAGIEEVILYFNFGALSHVETMKNMERFAKEVLPHFESAAVSHA